MTGIPATATSSPLFEQLFSDLAQSIADGVLRPGSRLPSLRDTSRSRRLSITTVKRAYQLLETQGLIEGRPKSGYFVRVRRVVADPVCITPRLADAESPSEEQDVSRIVLSTMKAISLRDATGFGSPFPNPALFPWRRVHQRMGEVARRNEVWDPLDDIPPGRPELIREIARRHLHNGLDVDPQEIIVTVGATEAIHLCLHAVARAGQAVAVESPCYFGVLQALEALDLRAVEIPADPVDGIDLAALEAALQREPIAALVSMPNFQNPLGFVMPDARKRALVELARRHGMPIIENGVYNELYYGASPPTTLKCHDTDGSVLHCGSFSKSLAAGVRVGWVLPGRWRAEVEKLKFLNTVSNSGIGQMSLARYLVSDGWDYLLRGVRKTLEQRRDILRAMVMRFFPEGTRCSQPSGGYVLWVELPGHVDGLALHRQALQEGIAVTPGRVFGTADRYRNCLRLNYSYEWTPAAEAAFRRLAALVAAATPART
ncbi:PLP-dependent aminotransferase family protein [Paucibacter sp. R3-3]|uniref:PLP-dependent aminotransferase family protein n=1 Tax=Roseateles agri TaxID=3098619 RepID=A0ABU5DDE5_9BURK|nr:PLP-dependent aminotransferase family protein [Paucibacter sp. R3-3]MDY0743775.1 PLP-dependent aminotransferase family protein [Paucibacter sp. R3-3]